MIGSVSGITDWLVWPTSCLYSFWFWVILVISGMVAATIYKTEKANNPGADFWNALGVSCIVMVALSLFATLVKNTAGIPMLQQDLFLIVLAISSPILLIWFFKS